MKKGRTPQQTAENASNLHKHVGQLLAAIPSLKNFTIRQEYPVSRINPEFSSNRERVDWAIIGPNIAIEAHGEQHFEPVQFGGRDLSEAKIAYRKTLESDENKRQAIIDAGWAYVMVKYNETDLTAILLEERIRTALADRALRKSSEIIKQVFDNIKKTEKHKRKKTKWPSRKIPSRKFPKKQK